LFESIVNIRGFTGSIKGYKDGNTSAVQFNDPTGIALDNDGNIFVADGENKKIRIINSKNGDVTTIAELPVKPRMLTIDSNKNIFVSAENLIYKITYAIISYPTPEPTPAPHFDHDQNEKKLREIIKQIEEDNEQLKKKIQILENDNVQFKKKFEEDNEQLKKKKIQILENDKEQLKKAT